MLRSITQRSWTVMMTFSAEEGWGTKSLISRGGKNNLIFFISAQQHKKNIENGELRLLGSVL